jgi:DNA (cytosine-5)-methyltransferase 1
MSEQSTFWPEEHLASLSPSPVSERDWMTRVATSPSSLLDLLADSGPYGWCGRTSPVSCRSTTDGRLEPFSGCWSNSGMGSPTEFLTLNISEYPSDGVASSLSDILEDGEVPQRYYLSGTACRGLTDTAPTIDAGCKDGFIRNQLGVGVLSSTDEISHCLNAGGMGRQDYESETLIAHALSADGFDASEDGTGRGTPVVPVAICTAHTQSNGSGFSDDVAHTLESGGAQAVAFAQNSRDEVRLYGGDGKTVGALAAQPGAKQQSYVAFSAKDYGADADNVAPTLRGMGHDRSHANGGGQVAIAFTQNQEGDVLSGDVMQSLGTNANATGRNAPTVAFTLHGSDGTASAASPTDIAGSLRTRAPGSIENSSTTAVLQEQPVAWSGELTASTDVAGTLQRGGEGGRLDGVMTPQMAVRRLTPRECERLQGFPDDYTLVEYRSKPAADGPRYKALGNSMAVPVMRWIGERIAAVDAILHDGAGTGSVS